MGHVKVPAPGELWTVRYPMSFFTDRLIPVAPGEPILILPRRRRRSRVGAAGRESLLLHILVKGHEAAAYVGSWAIIPLEEWMLR